jgi:hypothetical protein
MNKQAIAGALYAFIAAIDGPADQIDWEKLNVEHVPTDAPHFILNISAPYKAGGLGAFDVVVADGQIEVKAEPSLHGLSMQEIQGL